MTGYERNKRRITHPYFSITLPPNRGYEFFKETYRVSFQSSPKQHTKCKKRKKGTTNKMPFRKTFAFFLESRRLWRGRGQWKDWRLRFSLAKITLKSWYRQTENFRHDLSLWLENRPYSFVIFFYNSRLYGSKGTYGSQSPSHLSLLLLHSLIPQTGWFRLTGLLSLNGF